MTSVVTLQPYTNISSFTKARHKPSIFYSVQGIRTMNLLEPITVNSRGCSLQEGETKLSTHTCVLLYDVIFSPYMKGLTPTPSGVGKTNHTPGTYDAVWLQGCVKRELNNFTNWCHEYEQTCQFRVDVTAVIRKVELGNRKCLLSYPVMAIKLESNHSEQFALCKANDIVGCKRRNIAAIEPCTNK